MVTIPGRKQFLAKNSKKKCSVLQEEAKSEFDLPTPHSMDEIAVKNPFYHDPKQLRHKSLQHVTETRRLMGRRQGVAGPLRKKISWLRPCFQRKLCFSPDRNSSLCKKEVGQVIIQRTCFSFKDFATNLDVAMISMLLSLDDEAIACLVMDSWLISFELLFFTQWSYDCCLKPTTYKNKHQRANKRMSHFLEVIRTAGSGKLHGEKLGFDETRGWRRNVLGAAGNSGCWWAKKESAEKPWMMLKLSKMLGFSSGRCLSISMFMSIISVKG
ncbi:LOW QUALITY PROTEIN: hypothetical protein NC652_011077 [Populus alba x Populus x berolinensis]|nr:LOW QUALITY PROTEIN: hypothetical protein NC652_011077 [Populus alba x Populus x berolinensis]